MRNGPHDPPETIGAGEEELAAGADCGGAAGGLGGAAGAGAAAVLVAVAVAVVLLDADAAGVMRSR